MRYLLITLYILILTIFFSELFQIPIENSYITSSFGEYRNTGNKPHFHTGIDFSSFSKAGIPIRSIENGYVYKIWLNEPIYGNTIFIYHPSINRLSVYAHLSSFNGIVQNIVDSVKKEFGNNFAKINFPKKEIVIKKRDIIGFSGKSGEAQVPNVHFEIREIKKFGDNKIEIVEDALEYINYTDIRKKELVISKIRINNNIYNLSENVPVEIPFYLFPKIEINIFEKVGENTKIIPKRVSLKINDEMIYKIEFDKIRDDEMYSPDSIFGYGSNLYNYWVKLYSTSKITPIKINRWNEFLNFSKERNCKCQVTFDPLG
ncbi:M23 family metallopeptidase [Marinitoga sp. 1137]|uniref:M23 family metallopeptidase n=1 Tax=Marinitoga sp. 1137 TaxID=1545835 RepID=UPI0009514C15|nr:M23 family metallopeptidase [Marinitoga sp. 1137]